MTTSTCLAPDLNRITLAYLRRELEHLAETAHGSPAYWQAYRAWEKLDTLVYSAPRGGR